MKKVTVWVLFLTLCLGLTACGGKKRAFEASKAAYEQINTAYEITQLMGEDIYQAWLLSIQDWEDVLEDGISHIAPKLNINEAEFRKGVAFSIAELLEEGGWDSLSEKEQKDYLDNADAYFDQVFRDDPIAFCVLFVRQSYAVSGKTAQAQAALDAAKKIMRELSDTYSDYEHYPSLKGYYTTTSAYFSFCQNPTGSFDQMSDTVNKYANEARDYISSLDYIFEN